MVRTKRAELHRSFRSCRDFLVAMIPLVGMSMYLYGFRPFIIVLLAGVNAMLCDLTNALLRRRPYDVTDLSSIVFAEVFALMMPASVSYGVILIGTAVTVLLGKHAFGGYENYPCHPAAFGISFAAVCWPSQVFSYPKPFAALGLGFRPDVELFEASSHALNYGAGRMSSCPTSLPAISQAPSARPSALSCWRVWPFLLPTAPYRRMCRSALSLPAPSFHFSFRALFRGAFPACSMSC